jgi:hypothetical protein
MARAGSWPADDRRAGSGRRHGSRGRWPLAAAIVLGAALLPAAGPLPTSAASAISGLYLDSVGYDLVGTGVPTWWGSAGWSVTVDDGAGPVEVDTTAFGPDGYRDIAFRAPSGQHLVPGTFSGGVEMTGCQEPDASGFTILEIDAGMSHRLAVTFWIECFSEMSVFRGDLRINSDVPLRALVVDTLDAAFADGTAGTPGETKTITIGAGGNDPLTIASIALSGSAGDFSLLSETCTAAPVPAGSDCDIVVQATPQNGGLRTADLVIDDDTVRGSHSIRLHGTATGPASGITMGTVSRAGPLYAFSWGGALGRSVQSGTQRFHLVYGTYRVGGKWATDRGPFAGVYYIRSTTGATWSTPRRLNPTNQHATRSGLATAGPQVYVTWASQRSYRDLRGAPRAVYVRRNTSHGATTAWRSTVRLTSTTGRVDYPSIAAAGSDVYVTWTDSVTGSIKLAVSHDKGVTWKKLTVGSTSARDESGRRGMPRVAVSGSAVAVAWRADTAGSVKVRVSTNRANSWGTTATAGAGSRSAGDAGSVAVAVRGSRVAVAWLTETTVMARQRVSGTWADAVLVTALDSPETVVSVHGPVIALQDPARVAVAWAEERQMDGMPIRWAESADGGAHWFETLQLAEPTAGRSYNYGMSVVWPTAGTRLAAWTGEAGGTWRLYFRKATGTPVVP